MDFTEQTNSNKIKFECDYCCGSVIRSLIVFILLTEEEKISTLNKIYPPFHNRQKKNNIVIKIRNQIQMSSESKNYLPLRYEMVKRKKKNTMFVLRSNNNDIISYIA